MHQGRYDNLTVLIVEDDARAREELLNILSLDFTSVFGAKDGCEGYDLIQKYVPDIIISDIDMPCMDGLEMFEAAKKANSRALFFVTSALNERDHLHKAIDLKVSAYLVKPVDIFKLYEKINEELQQIEQRNESQSTPAAISALPHHTLSTREYDVMIDIAKGLKSHVIAEKYEIKPKTVSTYRARVLEKMQMSSNAELIHYAIAHRLI